MKTTTHAIPSPQCEPAKPESSARQATQGRWLIGKLKRSAHTYAQMLAYQRSCSPWKRVAEALSPHEQIVKGERNGLVTWKVVRTWTPEKV